MCLYIIIFVVCEKLHAICNSIICTYLKIFVYSQYFSHTEVFVNEVYRRRYK